MFDKMENAKVIKTGIYLYAGITPYEVRIIEWHTWYGTGDYEDSPDISEDKDITCYYVWFEDLIKKGTFAAGGGQYLTIEEAISSIEKKCDVKWNVYHQISILRNLPFEKTR